MSALLPEITVDGAERIGAYGTQTASPPTG